MSRCCLCRFLGKTNSRPNDFNEPHHRVLCERHYREFVESNHSNVAKFAFNYMNIRKFIEWSSTCSEVPYSEWLCHDEESCEKSPDSLI